MSARQISWLRVFVEGVVIVGSILLAFGLSFDDHRGAYLSRHFVLCDLCPGYTVHSGSRASLAVTPGF